METGKRVCEECGALFVPKTKRSRFCSSRCSHLWWKHHPVDHSQDDAIPGLPLREFRCAKCGKFVYVRNRNDKRTRFCCKGCEVRYWRHPQEGRRGLRTHYDLQRKTKATGGILCSRCRHCYDYTDGDGKSYGKCRLAERDFYRGQAPKTHPRWCPLLPGNKKREKKGEANG